MATTLTLNNRTLNPDFADEGFDNLWDSIRSLDTLVNVTEDSKENVYRKGVATLVRIGFDLDAWEVEIRNVAKIPSARGGGARSKGTGFIMPKTPKSYLHYFREAMEHGVELLDPDGRPRKLAEVKADIAAKKPVKDAEDKLLTAVATYVALRDNAVDSDPRTVDADNALLNYLRSRGYVVSVPVPAAA